jgi:hypothetical protein
LSLCGPYSEEEHHVAAPENVALAFHSPGPRISPASPAGDAGALLRSNGEFQKGLKRKEKRDDKRKRRREMTREKGEEK